MSLFDISGQYPSEAATRPEGRGFLSALTSALRRSREDASIDVIEDANTLKHRRREQGYLRDIGMEMGI